MNKNIDINILPSNLIIKYEIQKQKKYQKSLIELENIK